MSKPLEVPRFLINNVIELLNQAGEEGCEIGLMAQTYFTTFSSSIYVERYGFKNWGELLTNQILQPHATIFSNGQRVRSTKFGNQNQNNVQILQPHVVSTSQISGPVFTSLGGESSSSANNNHAPSSVAEMSVQSGTSGSRKRSHADTGDYEMENASETESGITDLTHATITPDNQAKLQSERQTIKWIAREVGAQHLDFNTLILERELKSAEPAMYIDCTFCDRDVLEKLMDVKALVKKVSNQKFTEIRNKNNQFEFEKGSIFQHGSAIKMANIDALMGFALSNPKNPDGSSMLGPNELLYFADVNGGPGGHAEYFLWKKKWQAKGFGITPRGKDEYKFEQAEHFPRESFETFYGESGTEGAGNIGRPIILSKFITFVKQSTDERGVHFMIASSGDTDDSADEDQKEIRCKYQFLAQLLLALKIIRQGGHYVTRIYDMYTPFTVGLIYLMYRTFEQVAVFKPESSLPASSEKYIICKWKKPDSQCNEIANYLSECHKVDWLTRRNLKRVQEDFAEIVHLLNPRRLQESFRFYAYVRQANIELGRRQIHETNILVNNIRGNTQISYLERRLHNIQTKCLQLWGVPQKVREKPKYSSATTAKIRGIKLLTPYSHDFFSKTESEGEVALFTSNIGTELKRPKEWRFMTVGKDRGFFLCLGGNKIYKYNKGIWEKVKESMELMNNTLVYADLVDELLIAGAKQSSLTALHIIDALVLGSKDIRVLPYNERYDLITKYSASLNKMSRDDLAPIRAKPSYELSVANMQKFCKKLAPFRNRGAGSELICPVDLNRPNDSHLIPNGVLFFKVMKENFSAVDFRFCLQNRIFWQLHSGIDITVPEDLQNYTPKVLVVKLDEHGEEKPLVHASNMLRHLTTPPQA